MKRMLIAGALALAALSLAACGSDPATGNPTFLGVAFTTGSASANAKLVSLGAKIDQGILTAQNIEQTDLPGLCQIATKLQPTAASAAPLLPTATQNKVAPLLSDLSALIVSPTCTAPTTGTLADALTLVQTIGQITTAIKKPAATVAAQ